MSKSQTINPRAVVQVLDLSPDALKFQVPMAMSISGPSQSGKDFYLIQSSL